MKRSKGLKRGKGFKPRKATGEKDFMMALLDKRGLVSYLSGRTVPRIPHSCAHILPKGHYKSRKFDPDNIVILHPDEHDLFDKGTVEDREAYAKEMEEKYGVKIDWDSLFDIYERMKAEEEQKE